MMRYHRVSPDCPPLSNGKKPNLRSSPARAATKEDNHSCENGRVTSVAGSCGGAGGGLSSTSLDGGGVSKGYRFRSPSRAQQDGDASHSQCPSPSHGGGDVLLQWGQRKRSRVSRAEIRSVTDDSSSSSSQGRLSANKLHGRTLNPSMPPPPSPTPLLCGVASGGNGRRGANLRNGLITRKESSGFVSTRNLEDKYAAASRGGSRSAAAVSVGKRSPPSPDKRTAGKDLKQNGFTTGQADHHHHHHHHHRVIRLESTAQIHSEQEANGEKGHVEVIEWPRIFIALSRKEKEEDFLAMKGTKLPHRPRKRAKNIDKALQYCFPGMWLSDLTKSRYEVREKKCARKQKRRGLKGMESMDTDSE